MQYLYFPTLRRRYEKPLYLVTENELNLKGIKKFYAEIYNRIFSIIFKYYTDVKNNANGAF